ncbi:arylsulfatase [Flammeovirga aprica]|uniref:Arylsulfatase n=1 Tax=Flammeovirga aprica JL-4 TaxID=694437 RepID=A0A7X9S0B7_9BACT|nr:arylsulfatase [Flammeovirga aprica]NME72005.1 arylsulfatase [Flammeovirga aprica JL-4]
MKKLIFMLFSALSFSCFAQEGGEKESISIPYPLGEWKGVAEKTIDNSKPYFIETKKAPEDAPNVLIIMLDDVGYGTVSSYGGPINTPAFDRIGDEGIRYSHMAVNAICSPTRGSLLTGYNMHQIGTGIVSEFSTGYSGYNNEVDYTTPALGKILVENGYATSAFGKWHNTKLDDGSAAGPFHNWPGSFWGFEYFYGFVGGEMNMFHPLVFENNTAVDIPKKNADGSDYHFTTDMTDKAIKWLDNWRGVRDEPFFMYYAPGACHAPIQPPADWRNKYKGKFNEGYEEMRDQMLERQKDLGLVPQDAKLVDWPSESIPAWDTFSERGQEYLSRQMEVNAAFLEHTDAQIARVFDHLEEMGELDNTLVIFFTADNGTTGEGTPTGNIQELFFQNGYEPLTMDEQLDWLDRMGGLEEWGNEDMSNHFATGWAYALSTPYQWTKQVGSHFGGTMAAMAIRYPKGIEAQGEWRRQFQFVTDIVPTVLEVTGVPAPDYVNGQKRKEYPGESLTYAWNDAEAETNHPTQYFECLGFMGLYHEGWSLAGKPYRYPWQMSAGALANLKPLDMEWELYNIDEDPIQSVNIADQNPEKIKELEKIFWDEAEKYDVFPIGGAMGRVIQPESNTSMDAKTNWVLTPNVYRLPENAAPQMKSNDYVINAHIEGADKDTDGVIYAIGKAMGGHALYVLDGKLRYTNSVLGYWLYENEGVDVPTGDYKVTLKHTITSERRMNGAAKVELFINDKLVDTIELERTMGISYGGDVFDVGRDEGCIVSKNYKDKGKFIFTPGKLKKVTFDISK